MEYDIDPYEFSEEDESILIEYSVEMFRHYRLLDEFNIREEGLRRFFDEVRKLYKHENQFHNFKHVWCVMHLSFQILIRGADKFLTSLDVFAVLIAAICHDIAHPGNSNAFEIATQTELSKMYTENCVLEKHHARLTKNLLTNEFGQELLRGLTKQQKEGFYAQIFQIIMATDMARHGELVKEAIGYTSPLSSPTSTAAVSQDFKASEPVDPKADQSSSTSSATPRSSLRLRAMRSHVNKNDPESRVRFTRVIVHSADLGAQTQCLLVAYRWVDRCYGEFRSQAEKERSLGIVTSPIIHSIDLESKKFADQANFITIFLEPLWKALTDFLPELRFAYEQLIANKVSYKEKMAVEYSKEESMRLSHDHHQADCDGSQRSHVVSCSSNSSDGCDETHSNGSSQDHLPRDRSATMDEQLHYQEQKQRERQPDEQSQAMEGVNDD